MLVLEPLNRYEDHMVNRLEQAVELVDAVGLPSRAGAGRHVPHEHRGGRAHVARWSRPPRGLGHVQVSDSNRFQPGAGHLDWAALLGTLDAIGYDGHLAVECRLRGEPAAAVAAIPGFLRRQRRMTATAARRHRAGGRPA